jgi:cleavage stimulation factor subunit 3
LHFAYAELQESQSKLAEVHKTFESLIGELHDQLEGTEASINAEMEAARASVPSTGVVNGELAMERDDRAKQVLDRRNKELEGMKGELGVVWTMLMRFARRAEGLKPARTIFGKARKDKYCPWGVYEAAGALRFVNSLCHPWTRCLLGEPLALMEYHCTKAADVATKIFEIGLKLFGDDPGFVVRYLGFLISINDENSESPACVLSPGLEFVALDARALFERVVGTFSPENARPLWERWARYEYHFGDLAATQKLEKRISEVYPNGADVR